MFKISKYKIPLILLSVSLFLLSLYAFLDVSFSDKNHLLYNQTSLFYILLASTLIVIMSFFNYLTIQIVCFLLSIFYTQRVITTYFVPSEFDYYSYLTFTHKQIELSALFYVGVAVAIFIGLMIFCSIHVKKNISCSVKYRTESLDITQNRISFFGISINFDIFIRYMLYLLIPLYGVKISLLLSGFARTGEVFDSLDSLLVRLDSLSAYLSVLGVFAFFYYPSRYKGFQTRNLFIVLCICTSLLLSSRALLLMLMSSYIFVKVLTKQKPNPNILWFILAVALFSVVIFYPAMTIFRGMMFNSDWSLLAVSNGFNYLIDNFFYLLFNLLERLGGFDWLTIWLTVDSDAIPPNGSLFGELVTHLNSLVLGDIYSLNGSVNLAKMQVLIGRGYGDLNELGGHQETMGALATSYVYFGLVFGVLYFAIWTILVLLVEVSRIHVLHKFVIINTYCFGFFQGGGFILMHQGLFYYLILCTVSIMILKTISIISYKYRSALI